MGTVTFVSDWLFQYLRNVWFTGQVTTRELYIVSVVSLLLSISISSSHLHTSLALPLVIMVNHFKVIDWTSTFQLQFTYYNTGKLLYYKQAMAQLNLLTFQAYFKIIKNEFRNDSYKNLIITAKIKYTNGRTLLSLILLVNITKLKKKLTIVMRYSTKLIESWIILTKFEIVIYWILL